MMKIFILLVGIFIMAISYSKINKPEAFTPGL